MVRPDSDEQFAEEFPAVGKGVQVNWQGVRGSATNSSC
jgi:hypothetical protein